MWYMLCMYACMAASQREASNALRIAVARRGMMTTPVTAQPTVCREATAALTTSRSAQVSIMTSCVTLYNSEKEGDHSVLLFPCEARLHGCKMTVRRSRAPSVLQGESDSVCKNKTRCNILRFYLRVNLQLPQKCENLKNGWRGQYISKG